MYHGWNFKKNLPICVTISSSVVFESEKTEDFDKKFFFLQEVKMAEEIPVKIQ